MDYFTPQTIDIEISIIFRPPADNLIHNAHSKFVTLNPPLLYTAGSEDSHEYLMRGGNISGIYWPETNNIYFLA